MIIPAKYNFRKIAAPVLAVFLFAFANLWPGGGNEHFYNFKGLRSYKDKFDPHWQSRDLASPGGLRLPAIFTNLTALISRSFKEVFIRRHHD